MDNPSATATAEEAPSGKQQSAATRGAGGGAKGRKQAAADGRRRAKKPAGRTTPEPSPSPSQRPRTARPKPAAKTRGEGRRRAEHDGRTHPEAPRRKPTRRTKPNPVPPSPPQQAPSPPAQAAPGLGAAPVEPAAAATPQAARVGPAATATPQASPPVLDHAARLRDLAERADAGDRAALADLRSMLDAHPEIWRHCGDLGRLAEEQWLDALTADALGRESIRRHIDKFKLELAGPQPTDLEWLMAQEVAACWLARKHAEAAAATSGGSVQQASFRSRRLEGAQKAYLRAVRMLMMLRLGSR